MLMHDKTPIFNIIQLSTVCFSNPGLLVQQLEDVVSQLHGLIVYIGRWTELFPSRNTSWQQENRVKN